MRINSIFHFSPFQIRVPRAVAKLEEAFESHTLAEKILTRMIILRTITRCNAEHGVDQQTKAVILAPD